MIDLAQAVAQLLREGDVRVDGRMAVKTPSGDEIDRVLQPLLRWCDQQRPASGRGVIGLAGPPGAGKTHVLAWLSATARVLDIRGVAFVSMDGYHLPNAMLQATTFVDASGEVVPLSRIKGTPQTFDAAKLLGDLRRLKSGQPQVSLPVYSRELHEPVPDAVVIGPETDWVVIEGNFLFLPQDHWAEIDQLLDRRIFLEGSSTMLRERLAQRNARTRPDASAFAAQYQRVDEPNDRLIRSTRSRADVIWEWSSEGRLQTAQR